MKLKNRILKEVRELNFLNPSEIKKILGMNVNNFYFKKGLYSLDGTWTLGGTMANLLAISIENSHLDLGQLNNFIGSRSIFSLPTLSYVKKIGSKIVKNSNKKTKWLKNLIYKLNNETKNFRAKPYSDDFLHKVSLVPYFSNKKANKKALFLARHLRLKHKLFVDVIVPDSKSKYIYFGISIDAKNANLETMNNVINIFKKSLSEYKILKSYNNELKKILSLAPYSRIKGHKSSNLFEKYNKDGFAVKGSWAIKMMYDDFRKPNNIALIMMEQNENSAYRFNFFKSKNYVENIKEFFDFFQWDNNEGRIEIMLFISPFSPMKQKFDGKLIISEDPLFIFAQKIMSTIIFFYNKILKAREQNKQDTQFLLKKYSIDNITDKMTKHFIGDHYKLEQKMITYSNTRKIFLSSLFFSVISYTNVMVDNFLVGTLGESSIRSMGIVTSTSPLIIAFFSGCRILFIKNMIKYHKNNQIDRLRSLFSLTYFYLFLITILLLIILLSLKTFIVDKRLNYDPESIGKANKFRACRINCVNSVLLATNILSYQNLSSNFILSYKKLENS